MITFVCKYDICHNFANFLPVTVSKVISQRYISSTFWKSVIHDIIHRDVEK